MDARQAMFGAIRTRLADSATMVAMVASSSITASRQRPVTTYPAIRMRVVGATRGNLDSFIAGDAYLNIYTNHRSPAGALASTYSVLRSLLDDKVTQLSTSNIGVGTFNEQYVDYPLYEEALDVFYLAARYSFTAQRKKTRVINVDGRYYAAAANSTVHDITTGDLSISAWITAASGSGPWGRIVWKNDAATHGYQFTINGDGKLEAWLYNEFPTIFGITGTTDLRDGSWHHVAVIFDRTGNSNCKLYVDGVDDTDSYTLDVTAVGDVSCNVVLTLGAEDGGTPTNTILEGKMADVKIYYGAWTSGEVVYQAVHPFDYSSSAGSVTEYWQCREGSGTHVEGSAGNRLTLNNSAAWVTDTPLR